MTLSHAQGPLVLPRHQPCGLTWATRCKKSHHCTAIPATRKGESGRRRMALNFKACSGQNLGSTCKKGRKVVYFLGGHVLSYNSRVFLLLERRMGIRAFSLLYPLECKLHKHRISVLFSIIPHLLEQYLVHSSSSDHLPCLCPDSGIITDVVFECR